MAVQLFNVLYDFAAEEEGELTVAVGQIVQAEPLVDEENPEGWILVRLKDTDDVGFVPMDYLDEIIEKPVRKTVATLAKQAQGTAVPSPAVVASQKPFAAATSVPITAPAPAPAPAASTPKVEGQQKGGVSAIANMFNKAKDNTAAASSTPKPAASNISSISSIFGPSKSHGSTPHNAAPAPAIAPAPAPAPVPAATPAAPLNSTSTSVPQAPSFSSTMQTSFPPQPPAQQPELFPDTPSRGNQKFDIASLSTAASRSVSTPASVGEVLQNLQRAQSGNPGSIASAPTPIAGMVSAAKPSSAPFSVSASAAGLSASKGPTSPLKAKLMKAAKEVVAMGNVTRAVAKIKGPSLVAAVERDDFEELKKRNDEFFSKLVSSQEETFDAIADMVEALTQKLTESSNSSNELVKKLTDLDELIDVERRRWKQQNEAEKNADVLGRSKDLAVSLSATSLASSSGPSTTPLLYARTGALPSALPATLSSSYSLGEGSFSVSTGGGYNGGAGGYGGNMGQSQSNSMSPYLRGGSSMNSPSPYVMR